MEVRIPGPAPVDANLDWWFRALDCCSVRIGAEDWLARVTGIHVDGDDLWVQFTHAEDPSEGFVLRLARKVGLNWRSAAGTGWTSDDPHPRVVNLQPMT